jgi:hypothetical protein
MNLDRDQLAQTMRQIALPALAGAAGTGALGAYMSSQSDHPGEMPSQRRHRILRNALVSAGLGGMAGAALPAGLKMLSEPYMGSGVTGGPGLVDKSLSFGASHLLPLAGAAGGAVLASKRLDHNRGKAMDYIHKSLGEKAALPPDLAKEVGIPELQNKEQLSQLFNSGDQSTKFLLDRLSAGEPSGTAGLNRLFTSADLMRTAGHPGARLHDLQRIYKPSGMVPEESFPVSFHRTPSQVDWNGAYADYFRNSNNPIDKYLLSRIVGNVERPEVARSIPDKLRQLAWWFAERSRPGSANVLGRMEGGLSRMGGPLAKLGLLGAGAAGLFAAHKVQEKFTGN